MAAETGSPRGISWVQKIINRFKTRREPESDRGGVAGGGETSRAEYLPKGRVTTSDHFVEYKAYRIHPSPHLTGLWISMIVSIGTRKAIAKDSLTEMVTRIPGEYPSEAEALLAARQYIDHLEGSEETSAK